MKVFLKETNQAKDGTPFPLKPSQMCVNGFHDGGKFLQNSFETPCSQLPATPQQSPLVSAIIYYS